MEGFIEKSESSLIWGEKKNFFAFLDDSDHVKKFIFESGKRGRPPPLSRKIPTFFFIEPFSKGLNKQLPLSKYTETTHNLRSLPVYTSFDNLILKSYMMCVCVFVHF